MDYNIWIVSPNGYDHTPAFFDSAIVLCEGIRACGHQCKISTDAPDYDATNIIVAHSLIQIIKDIPEIPEGSIIWNLEQITPSAAWVTLEYMDLMRKHKVWDYSPLNVKVLKKMGVNVDYCPVGYMPVLTRIPQGHEDIDILFVGTMSPRRLKITDELNAKGVKIVHLFGVYGQERDAYIARSKIMLNVHFYDTSVFEITRCSLALANKKCVVSEYSSDTELEKPFKEAIAFTDYNNLVDTCMDLLSKPEERKALAQKGYETIIKISQADIVRPLLCS